MGGFISLDVDHNKIEFYNKLEYENIECKVVQTIDSEKFIILIRDGWSIKKVLCRSYGYSVPDKSNEYTIFSKFNTLINQSNGILNAKIYGIDNSGYAVVRLYDSFRNYYINSKMLLLSGVSPAEHYSYDGTLLV